MADRKLGDPDLGAWVKLLSHTLSPLLYVFSSFCAFADRMSVHPYAPAAPVLLCFALLLSATFLPLWSQNDGFYDEMESIGQSEWNQKKG